MPDWIIVVVVALINFGGVFLSSKRAKKSEYINSVSASRREWLEKVRNNFIQYNRLVQEQKTQTSEFDLNHIEMNLLLNMSERYTHLLSQLYTASQIREKIGEKDMSDEELNLAIKENTIVDNKSFEQLKILLSNKELDEEELYYLVQIMQEIILKREWEIIKQEVKTGNTVKAKTQKKKTEKVVSAVDKDKKIEKLLNGIDV